MNIVELFPNYSKICNRKDAGQILVWLRKYGHKAILVTNKFQDNISLDDFDGVKVIKLPNFEVLSISLELLYYLVENIRQIDCILLYHLTINTAILSLVYRLFSNKGIIIVKLDTDGRIWKYSVPLFFKIYKLLFGETKIVSYTVCKNADLIIIESPDSKKRILKKYPFFEKKLVVLPNGIDSEQLTCFENLTSNIVRTKKILFVGQIIYRKGIDFLLEAFSRVKDLYPEWTVELVGIQKEIEYRQKLENLISSFNLQGRVFFTNHLEGELLIRKYLEAEIFCFPSRYENFPITLIEAMFLEIPIVSSNVGCADYILDCGNAGLIFESEDVEDLTLKLKLFIESETLRRRFAENAKKRCIELFTWDKIVSHLDKLIKNIWKANYFLK